MAVKKKDLIQKQDLDDEVKKSDPTSIEQVKIALRDAKKKVKDIENVYERLKDPCVVPFCDVRLNSVKQHDRFNDWVLENNVVWVSASILHNHTCSHLLEGYYMFADKTHAKEFRRMFGEVR